MAKIEGMHLTKKELRQLPLHELVDVVEATFMAWRFSDRNSALEGSSAAYMARAAHELDRRRRRALRGSCTCELCWIFSAAWQHSEEL